MPRPIHAVLGCITLLELLPTFSAWRRIEGMLRRYMQLKDHEYVAVSLWVVHTHIYDRFATLLA